MKPNVYNFFKFLNQKEQRPIPFSVKFLYAPETLTPQDLNVEGSLNLENTKITSLPKGLTVGGWLNLRNTKITSLPDGLTVGGFLNLYGCKNFTSLPKGLKVGDFLSLRNAPITSLPEDLIVKGDLWLINTPLSNKTDEEIRAMIGPNGYIKGRIYR